MLKITLSDNSFIISDPNDIFTIYQHDYKSRNVKASDLATYSNWFMIDEINGKRYKRSFQVETYTSGLPPNRYKMSQDIKKGDLLIGAENEPREVEELHSGVSEMYDIIIEGETYTVNKEHILSAVDIYTRDITDMSIDVFYTLFKDDYKDIFRIEKRNGSKSELVEFEIKPTNEEDNYYGFTLKDNPYHKMPHGEIFHNSGKSVVEQSI